ncbi:MAG: PD-(D/E)XK nuclease family protein [Thermoguttaceae bacterium]
MQRVFLGWDRPGLTAAVEYLVGRFGRPGLVDLGGVVIAVPGARAGRRLLELLVEQAEQQGSILTPPRIVTVGVLPELLYRAARPFASDLVQELVWITALGRMPRERLASVVPSLPAEGEFGAWLSLAKMLADLHRELAAEDLSFADVARRGPHLQRFRETRRWQVLAELQQRYLEVLDEAGLWDVQTARLVAIRQKECETAHELILVGTVDLNRAQRLILDQVSQRVTALVLAPKELADRFDEHGCVRPEAWQEARIDLRPEQIELADAPADQAAAVARVLASFQGRFQAEQITIGVPDEQLVPHLEHQLKRLGVAVRHGAGRPARSSSPCRLLEAAAEYLDGKRFAAFAALVRHPAIQDWLDDPARGLPGDWLCQLDAYYAEHLPEGLGHEWLGPEWGYRQIRRVRESVEELLSGLTGASRPLPQWGEPLAGLLAAVYGRRSLNRAVEPDRSILAVCEAIREILLGHQALPEALGPTISGAEALRLVLWQLEAERVPPPVMPGAVELLGWLELPLDDAPAMVVSGFNDGLVPTSINGDLFLPNQLRRALGVQDNQRRYARDAYALSVLAASREQLRLIAGRRSADGQPLVPSRLLFACEGRTLARRVKAFFSPVGEAKGPRPSAAPPPKTRIEIPQPRPLPEPVTYMNVTEFRDYLACPYRYYLRHRLGLVELSDQGDELDGLAFGDLAHKVLHRFGKGPAAMSENAEQIEADLNRHLDQVAREQYGRQPLVAIQVQVEQLRARLKAFARWQADWAAKGWKIMRVEAGDAEAFFQVDGRKMILRGRIDRIDFNRQTGQWAIFDYKTSERPQDPETAHRKGGRWIDLQLPLYRHLGRGLGLPDSPALGYILLPRDPVQVGQALANWTEEDLESADRAAEEVIRSVWAERFWPPAEAPPGFGEFATICQEQQFSRPFAAEQDAERGAEEAE